MRIVLLALFALAAFCVVPAPAHAPPVIAAAVIYGAAYAAGYIALSTAIMAVAMSALSYVISQANKPKAPSTPDFSQAAQDRTLSVRQPTAPRRSSFGVVRISGVQTFLHVTGSSKEFLHMVVTCSGHRFRSFRALMLDDEIVPLDSTYGVYGGNATGKYAGCVTAVFGLGTTAGDADFHSQLQANCPDKWTASHQQTGCAKAYVRFKYDSAKFPGSFPNASFIVEAYDAITDPRAAGSPTQIGFTNNPALCLASYLRWTEDEGGLGAAADEVDEDDLIAAANACDEMVARKPVAVSFTADPSTGLITLPETSASLRLGTRLRLRGPGSPDSDGLAGGLVPYTDYFWAFDSPLVGRLATSLANARAGITVTLSSAGSAGQQIVVNAEPRFTCDGSFELSQEPEKIIEGLLSSMAGALTYAGGKWHIYAGVWRPATVSFGKGNLDGGITVQTRRSRRDLANGVKGVFVNPDASYVPTDYPAVRKGTAADLSDDTYLIEDNGERIWQDRELQYTNSPSMAQRLGRIQLERIRRQISTKWPLNLSGLKAQAMNTVALNNDLWGWTEKTFELSSLSFALRGDMDTGGDAAPRLGLDLNLNEIDATVFAWDETVNELTMAAAATTDLPDPLTVAAPTGLTLESGTAVLGVREDGTVFSRILATWTPPADIFVTSGGQIEIEFRKSSGSPTEDWRPYGTVRGDQTRAFILDVDDGEAYQVGLTARNAVGIASGRTVSAAHTVAGKSVLPSNVTGYSVQQNGNVCTHRYNQVSDADLAGYEMRFKAAPFDWDLAQVLTSVTRGTLITNTALPPGGWVCGVKAVDTSGNYSATAATFAIEVTNNNDVIEEAEQAPYWRGTKTNFIRHWSGVLIPESTKAAAEHTNQELFEQYVPYGQASCVYDALEMDLGFNAIGTRVYHEHEAPLGRGIAAATTDPVFLIDYRNEVGAYDGFEAWTIGTADFRRLKGRLTMDATTRRAYVSSFKPVLDAEERTITFSFVGGTPVTFSPQFSARPNIQLTPESDTGSPSAPRYATYENDLPTGFTPRVWNGAGVEVIGAPGNGQATGV